MKDALNMENLKLPIGKNILCFIGKIKCWVWKRKILFFYMEINEPSVDNRKLVYYE